MIANDIKFMMMLYNVSVFQNWNHRSGAREANKYFSKSWQFYLISNVPFNPIKKMNTHTLCFCPFIRKLLVFENLRIQLIWIYTVFKTQISGFSIRGQKFHSSAGNYEWNLERTSNSSKSTVKNLRVKLAFTEYWLWNLVIIWDSVMKLTW